MKLKIQTNLDQLEKGGLMSRKDNYQSIINSVVQVRTDELTKAMNICSIPWSWKVLDNRQMEKSYGIWDFPLRFVGVKLIILIILNYKFLSQLYLITDSEFHKSAITGALARMKQTHFFHAFQDIRNQRLYRQRRKQEMMRIKTTQKSLETKKLFYSEQIEYYNKYVKTCLDNLSTKGK